MKLNVLKEQQSEMKKDLLISIGYTWSIIRVIAMQCAAIKEKERQSEMKEDVCEKECKGRCTYFRRHY